MKQRIGVALVVLVCGGGIGRAQAACTSPEPMRPAAVQDFVDDPASLLRRHPNAGLPLAYEVQSLALASRDGLEGVLAASRRASFEQAEAIGVGLKKAVLLCAARDPDLVRRIRDSVRNQTNRSVVTGYTMDERSVASPKFKGAEITGSDSAASGRTLSPGLSGASLTPAGRDDPASPSRLSPTQALDGSDLKLSSPDQQSDPFKVD